MTTKINNLLLLFFVFSLTSNVLSAQKCKTSELRNEKIQENPLLLERIEDINTFSAEWISENENNASTRELVTLPVVVHVVWRESQENISDAQILSQMEVLNKDYRKLNTNFSSTPTAFQALAADVELEFCLATIDPEGNTTNGITRTQTTVDNLGETEDWYSTASGGKTPWDNTKYINVWVMDMGEDGTLGFATPPGTAGQDDGMVIGYQFFGTTGAAANSAPNNLGRTATHEMGHYLNLEHVWGPNNGGCNEDDFVEDTPNQEQENYDCPTFPLLDGCTGSGDGVMFCNYLDYVDDNCMTMFTQGQKMRMLAAVNGPRAGLLTSNVCQTMTANENIFLKGAINIFPNPSSDQLNISISDSRFNSNNQVKLVDLLGKEHKSFSMGQTKTIDISGLTEGVYFLVFGENVVTEKIIISKK